MSIPPLPFVSYDDSRDRPNVVVDGSPNAATVLTLAHWPGTPAPTGCGADTSTQMVFRYLDHDADREPADRDPADRQPMARDSARRDSARRDSARRDSARRDSAGWRAAPEVVTNNHFDQDGLAGIYALVEPDAARRHRALLEDIAAAGDFGVFHDRRAARLSMAVDALADPQRSPLDFAAGEHRVAAQYRAVLEVLPAWMDDPDRYGTGLTRWQATAPDDLSPTLSIRESSPPSSLAPDALVTAVCEHLRRCPPAWDPGSGRLLAADTASG